MNRYILSPEFHRHLWLRFSWLRALFVPVALLCVIYSHYMIYDERWAEIASGRLFWAYVLIVGLWGNHEAANALRDEVRANTWDMQRMTPCGPAPWIFGKVLGVTCFVWYVALLVLAAAFALYFIGGAPILSRWAPLGAVVTAEKALYAALFMVLGGFLGHAVTFLVSFDGIVGKAEPDPRNRRPRTVAAFVAGLGVGWLLVVQAGMSLLEHGRISRWTPTVNWYDMALPTEVFTTLAAVFFGFWVLVGLYRLAKAEMMYALTPLYWFLGVLCIALFVGGLAFDPRMATRGSIFEDYRQYAFPFYIFTFTLAATYYAMLANSGDLRRYARMFAALRAGKLRQVFENMPQWLASMALVLAAYAFVIWVVRQPVASLGGLFVKPSMYITLASTLILFALRDGLAMHVITALSQSPSQKFERGAYYVSVYFLLPATHLVIVLKNMAVDPMRFLAVARGEGTFHPIMYFGWYYPNIFPGFVFGILPVVVQIGFIGIVYLVLRRRGEEADKTHKRETAL